MPTTIKIGIKDAVGIRGRQAKGNLSRDVLLKLGFKGCIGVRQIKLKIGHSSKWERQEQRQDVE